VRGTLIPASVAKVRKSHQSGQARMISALIMLRQSWRCLRKGDRSLRFAGRTALHPLEGRKEPPLIESFPRRPSLHTAGSGPGTHLDGRLRSTHAAAVIPLEALIDTLLVVRAPRTCKIARAAHCWRRRGSLRLGAYLISNMAAKTQRCVLPRKPIRSNSSWRRNTSSSGTLTRMAQRISYV